MKNKKKSPEEQHAPRTATVRELARREILEMRLAQVSSRFPYLEVQRLYKESYTVPSYVALSRRNVEAVILDGGDFIDLAYANYIAGFSHEGWDDEEAIRYYEKSMALDPVLDFRERIAHLREFTRVVEY